MKTLLSVACVMALVCSCASSPSGALPEAAPLESVSSFETERYLGRWFEISKYPMSFEAGLVGVTAEYSLREDGRVQVVNSGFQGDFDGERERAEAVAWAPDPDRPAELKVQFFWPFRANYWVIALAPDYSWAVVGEPKRRYLWVLSRTPSLPDATYARILERVTEAGYDVSRIEMMPQAPAP